MDCSLPGFSVHGTLQARILEWVAMPSSRGIFLMWGLNLQFLPFLRCRWILHRRAMEEAQLKVDLEYISFKWMSEWVNTWKVPLTQFSRKVCSPHALPLWIFFLRLYYVAYRILVPHPGIEHVPTALGEQSLNHRNTREIHVHFSRWLDGRKMKATSVFENARTWQKVSEEESLGHFESDTELWADC